MNTNELVAPSGAALTHADVVDAAKVLGVAPERVWAVTDVESAGRGLHPLTRKPVILYEPHVFHKRTEGRFSAAHPDLSYPKWGAKPYPKDQAARWDQMARAMALDERAALESASWGLFQIMGFNARLCGFDTVQAFARAMAQGERAQLLAFVRFLGARGLVDELQRGDWAGFAKAYNGPAYAQHGYDQKLKAAFEKRQAQLRRADA